MKSLRKSVPANFALVTFVGFALALGSAVLASAPAEAAGQAVQIAPPDVNFQPTDSYDLRYVVVTNLTSDPIKVTPTGEGLPAPFSAPQVDSSGAARWGACHAYATSGESWPAIDPGETCRVYYEYTSDAFPSGDLASSATATIAVRTADDDTLETRTIQLNAPKTPAPNPATTFGMKLAPTSISFGTVDKGSTVTKSVKLTNTSNGNVQFKVTYPNSGKPFDEGVATTAACFKGSKALVLAPNSTCTIRPRFTPTTASTVSGQLTVAEIPSEGQTGHAVAYSSAAALGSKAVPLKGRGRDVGAVLSPTKLDFGSEYEAGSEQSRYLKITNNSKINVAYELSGDIGSFDGPFVQGYYFKSPGEDCHGNGARNLNLVVAPGGYCYVKMTLRSYEPGDHTGNLVVTTHDESNQTGNKFISTGSLGPVMLTKSVPMTGTVKPQPTYTTSAVNFGNVVATTTKSVAVTFTNTSKVKESFALKPGNDEEVQTAGTTCRNAKGQYRVVAAGETCQFMVAWTPYRLDRDPGDLEATLYVTRVSGTYGAPSDELGSRSIAQTGTAIGTTVSVNPAPLDFGNVAFGSSKTKTLTVTNTSPARVGYRLDPQGLPSDTGAFVVAYTGNPPPYCYAGLEELRIVPPGGKCVFDVTFTPTTFGDDHTILDLRTFAVRENAIADDSDYEYYAKLSDSDQLGFLQISVTGSGVLQQP